MRSWRMSKRSATSWTRRTPGSWSSTPACRWSSWGPSHTLWTRPPLISSLLDQAAWGRCGLCSWWLDVPDDQVCNILTFHQRKPQEKWTWCWIKPQSALVVFLEKISSNVSNKQIMEALHWHWQPVCSPGLPYLTCPHQVTSAGVTGLVGAFWELFWPICSHMYTLTDCNVCVYTLCPQRTHNHFEKLAKRLEMKRLLFNELPRIPDDRFVGVCLSAFFGPLKKIDWISTSLINLLATTS